MNVTMSIDEGLLRKAKRVAFEKNASLNGMFRQYLEDLVSKEELGKKKSLDELKQLFKKYRSNIDMRKWKRNDLYAR